MPDWLAHVLFAYILCSVLGMKFKLFTKENTKKRFISLQKIRYYRSTPCRGVRWGYIKVKLEIVLEQEEDGTYSVHCPALKGCHSQGETRDEALRNIQEAIQLYLEVANEKARKELEQHPKSTAVEIAV